MEDKNKTQELREQDNSLDSSKPQIFVRFKEYIEKELPEKTKKKYKKFIEKALNACEDQIIFGESPSYDTGYVYGNVTAEGSRDIGDTTYTNTITLDLQTPEYVFFDMNNDEHLRQIFKRACLGLGFRRFVYTAKKHVTSRKQISKVYVCDYEDEALQDYAMNICEEQLAQLNCSMDECRVNDYDFVQTQETQVSNIYPVYLAIRDKKGNNSNVLIGYYNADKDDMYFEIDLSSDVLETIIGIFFIAPLIIAAIVAVVLIIGTIFGIIQW